MKTNLYILFLLVLVLPFGLHAQIEKVIVETYYISDATDSLDADGGRMDTGSVTYRVYIDLMPGNKLHKVYGDKNHPLKFSSTEPFFNNVDGETYAKDIKKGLYAGGTVGLDTWLTIGQTAAKTTDNKANFGILKTQDPNGSFITGIPGGLLSNTVPAMGIPLSTADGMISLALPSYTWNTFGIKNFFSGTDSTIFGSLVKQSSFTSTNVILENKFGVVGPVPDTNQILVAQLTTKGKLAFELNIEIEQTVDGNTVTARYVANGDSLVTGETVSSYLKYPYVLKCGCKNPNYLEYSAKYECVDSTACRTRVIYGCLDTMACNFDPNANFSLPFLCCYPGSCNGRDIELVCPQVKGASTSCTVYPNPAQNTLFLDVSSGIEENMSYSVYNYSGTQVLSETLGRMQQIFGHAINLTGFSNGLYLIKVNAGNEIFNIQFIKD